MTGQPASSGRPSLPRAAIGIVAYGLLGFSLAQVFAILFFSAAAWAGGPIDAWSRDPVTGAIFLVGVAILLGFLGANVLVGSRVFGLTPSDLRWKGAGPPLPGFSLAFGLGLVLVAVVMGLAALFGGARWSPDEGDLAGYIGRVSLILLMLAPSALAEEVMFRGLPIVVLDRSIGRGAAVGITALAFALTHSGNESVTTLSIANLCVAGLLLGLVFFAPGGIWTATGLHLGWNWAMGAGDAPISGLALNLPFIDYHPGQPAWLTGGAFGPEGGILATLVLGGATILAAKKFLSNHQPDMEGRP